MAGRIAVIGGANMDIGGFSRKPMMMKESNFGRVRISAGGAGSAEVTMDISADLGELAMTGVPVVCAAACWSPIPYPGNTPWIPM